MIQCGVPGYIRSANGSELIPDKVQVWLTDHHIKAIYIDRSSLLQNGYIESFRLFVVDHLLRGVFDSQRRL